MVADEGDTTRLLRLLNPYAGSYVEDGGMIVKTKDDDGSEQLMLRMDAEGDRPLETLEESVLADLLCQLRGHSGW